ncbi:hypothetical protein [Rhizobium sp. WW_1]|jgi:hypothetical protein|uniref:hypothetical protein n=1 Tax=Rhizobium sp. WW_1 TaxID=1907375 RepID=UPI000648506B|nr:hypothetical protein [Rhizobium sp. WW_1]RKD61549.1 hypothetical protein BJ928_107150 [Rhizobium sp. WW_1]
MTIKMLAGIAGVDFALSPGDETSRFSFEDEEDFIAAALAVRVAGPTIEASQKPKAEKAVKPKARETR